VTFYSENKTSYKANVSGGMYEVTLPIGRYTREVKSPFFNTNTSKVCVRSSANVSQSKHTVTLTPVPEPPKPIIRKLVNPIPTEPEVKLFTLRGYIKNSVTGLIITNDLLASGNFTMEFVDKVTHKTYKATVQKGGIWQIILPAGNYVRDIRMKDFAEMTEDKKVTESSDELTKDNILFISPTVRGFRVVLTWGKTPLDLDAHVILPDAVDTLTGEVFFDKRASPDKHVILDLDATTGYGPETISFTDIAPGVYQYYVNRYSNEAPIQKSKAKVIVFKGNKLIRTYKVPRGGDPTSENWHVFNIDTINHQIVEVNKLKDMW